MPPVGLEPTISVGERPQTHALDLAATGTGGSGRLKKLGWYFASALNVRGTTFCFHIFICGSTSAVLIPLK